MTHKRSEMTAYAKMNLDVKRSNIKKAKNVGMRRVAQAVGRCEARTRAGAKCQNAKGSGTTHPGIGRCKFHGGNAPTHVAHAAKQQAIFMGAPKDMHPLDAIMWCIRITAGEIEWLSEQIAKIDAENKDGEWFEHTVIGKQMNILVRERSTAQDRLVKYSKDALSLGIAERAVRLAEQYGHTLARLFEGVLGDLKLTTEQKKMAPHVIRKHMVLLENNRTLAHNVIEQEPLVAIPERVAS